MNKPSEPVSVFLELDRQGNIRIYQEKDKHLAVSKSRGELLLKKKEFIYMGILPEKAGDDQ